VIVPESLRKLRKSSTFAIRQAAAQCYKLHFPRYRLVSFMKIRSAVPENGLSHIFLRMDKNKTRLNPFAGSRFYNATAVCGTLWWLRKSHVINYANHQHSPFARRRNDFRQAAALCFKLHFPRHRLVKVSWKSVQPFPRTVVSYFWRTEKKLKTKKKTKKNICKTYMHPPPTGRRLRKPAYKPCRPALLTANAITGQVSVPAVLVIGTTAMHNLPFLP